MRMKDNVVCHLFEDALPRALFKVARARETQRQVLLPRGGGVSAPADRKAVGREVATVDSGVLRGLRLVDMGSGDGRVVLAGAAHGMTAVGWELNPVLVAASRVAALQAIARRAVVSAASTDGDGNKDLGSARFRTTNFWDASASLVDADVVTIYGLPELIERLQQKLLAELKPGAIVVSHRFAVTDWRPLIEASSPLGDPDAHPLYVYDVHAAEAERLARGGGARLPVDNDV